jgi:predicted ester cyclase
MRYILKLGVGKIRLHGLMGEKDTDMSRKRIRWSCSALMAALAVPASVSFMLAQGAETKDERTMRAAPSSINQNDPIVDKEGRQRVSEANKAVMRRLIEEVINQKNLSLVDELVAPDYVGHYSNAPEARGAEVVKQRLVIVHTAFPDWHTTIEDMIAEGDKVVTRWRASGTHRGVFLGIAPTGKRITTTGIYIDRIVNGKDAEHWSDWNALGVVQQLGAFPQ